MSVLAGELAGAVAVVHLLAVALLLSGALLALRWPRLLPVHLIVAGSILAINLAGADCPLTTLEQALRAAAGEAAYTGGFLSHYLVEPFYAPGMTATVSRIVYAVALTPNLLAAALFAVRAGRRRSIQALA
jgi:hypothetical protein